MKFWYKTYARDKFNIVGGIIEPTWELQAIEKIEFLNFCIKCTYVINYLSKVTKIFENITNITILY